MKTSTTYKTKQKDQIMELLIKNKDHHLTADELMAALNQDKPGVGKTTVYRYLDKLVSQGVVRKYFFEEGKSACYQYMEQNRVCNEHYHLKCVDCGRLFHLECNYLSEMDSHIRNHHDFLVDHSKTVLYGHCSTCSGRTEGTAE